MESSLRYVWVLVAFMLLRGVRADCKSYGVDFSNGGSYQIDGSSNQYFSFISVFQGKRTSPRSSLRDQERQTDKCRRRLQPREHQPRPRQPRWQRIRMLKRRYLFGWRPSDFNMVGPRHVCFQKSWFGDSPQYLSGIPFSAMKSGVWKIVLESNQIAVQRSITLKIGAPETVVVTVCHTYPSASLRRARQQCIALLTNPD